MHISAQHAMIAIQTGAGKMGEIKQIGIALLCLVFCNVPLLGQTGTKRVGEIKYLSQQSIYINLGSKQGLRVGDTLVVKRKQRTIGKIVVENVANYSSACKKILGDARLQKGDAVEIYIPLNEQQKKASAPIKSELSKSAPPATYQRKVYKKQRAKKNNVLSGNIGLQTIWLNDQSGSNLGYKQFGLKSKIKIKRFLSLPLEFQMRWRSRNHHRDRFVSGVVGGNSWTHRVQEFSLQYKNGDSPYAFEFGRILSNEVRGLGYIDGAALSYKFYGPWRFGFVGGMEPGIQNSAVQTNEQKFGTFLSFEKGGYRTQRLESTVAFSGSYHNASVSREFVYLQNSFNMGSKFSVYQTVEFDLNRGWKGRNSALLQLTNFFLSTNYSPAEFLTLNVSYDSRKAVRMYETRSIPDSLFDETTRQGFHSGLTLRLSRNVRFSGSFGVRLRKGNLNNTYSASGALNVRQIFHTWVTVNTRFSYFSTMFSKGYRPQIAIRFPVTHKLSTNLSGGSYIFSVGNNTTHNDWWEATAYYRINRWLYTNVGYHAYLDNQLQSGRIFIESGIVF